jgi:hypothetical protein
MTEIGRPGTGKYEGATWDGRRWVVDGEEMKVGPWSRTGPIGRAFLLTLFAALILLVSWPIAMVMSGR